MTDRRLRARILRSNALAGLGKYQEAIALAEEARAIAVAYGAPSWTLWVNQRVGSLRSTIGTNEAHRVAVADALACGRWATSPRPS